MTGQTVEMHRVFVAPLVAVDDAHLRRFTDDRDARGQATLGQFVGQVARAKAADFFVVSEGEMHRALPDAFREMRRHRQCRCDKTFHVARAPTVKAAVVLLQRERIARPGLISDRNDIAVARQEDAAIPVRTERGKEVGLGSAG